MSQHEMEMKSFGPFEVKDEDRGEVMAVVATLGVVDKDGDVILPGAFPVNGSRVKLSGYGHDVVTEGRAPAGSGVIYERDGKAVFEGKFFMSTARGREAFHTTKELGPDGEWSFGFPKSVKTGQLTDEWKTKGARRVITGLLPLEASPVFVGAGWGTGTLLTKSAEEVPTVEEMAKVEEVVAAAIEDGRHEVVTVAEIDQAALDAALAAEMAAEAKAAAEAAVALKAQRDNLIEALESQGRTAKMLGDNPALERVQRALKRMGLAA